MPRLLILINPENNQERNQWRNTMPNRNAMIIINPDANNDNIEGNIDNQLFTNIKIVGHGGNGEQFFHGLNQNQVRTRLNDYLTNRVANNVNCRFQVCSFGNGLGLQWLNGMNSLTQAHARVTAPQHLSAIWNATYYDFPHNAIGDAGELVHIKNVARYIHANRPNNNVVNVLEFPPNLNAQQREQRANIVVNIANRNFFENVNFNGNNDPLQNFLQRLPGNAQDTFNHDF